MYPQPQPGLNPFAPSVYNGMNDASPEGFIDVDFTYPYDVSLTASQELQNQSVSTTNDADFAARGIVIASATGSFNIKWRDSQGFQYSSGYIASANLLGDAASPFPIWPEMLIPAGGKIEIDIQDTSAAPNTIEILWRGVKRFRVAR